MDRNELRKLIQGTVVTTPTPMDKDMKVDYARITEVTRWWVEQGLGTNVAPLKVCAAGGEGPALTDSEWEQVIRTTVNAAGPDAVIMCALKAKSTYHTIEDAKKAQDLGIVGLQVDLPFSYHPNQDDYVRFFTDVSDAIDIGIMIYNTFWWGCPGITPETMNRLRDAERVVALKFSSPPDRDYDEMQEYSDHFNVINNGGKPVRCHQLGGRGYISSTATAYAPYDLKFWSLLEAKRYDEAQAQMDFVDSKFKTWREKNKNHSGGYQHLKAYMKVSGWDCGETREPSHWLSDELMDELRDIFHEIGWPVRG